jgi:hypothetical protein
MGSEGQLAEILDATVQINEGPTIKFSHLYLQIANAIFLISNVVTDVLILRLMMIVANIFLFLWGGFVLSTALDVLIYSVINLLINLVFSIPLILARIPIKFEPEIEDVYNRFFSSYVSKVEFKILIDK